MKLKFSLQNRKIRIAGKVIGISLITFFILVLLAPLPSPLFDVPYATTLRSGDGTLLSASIAKDQQWRFPVSDSIPHKFEIALLLFEDEYFHYHPGINPISIFRAIKQNIQSGSVVSGGSTLSMQTVRMALGNRERTYGQKIIEIFSALKLELFYKKSSILKQYANHAPFGGNIVGINAAAWRYFGRSPYQLSWAETAALAILPNNPSSIFPGKNQELFLEKRNRLLTKIHERGYIDQDELFLAKEEPLPQDIKPIPNQAYHLLHRSINEGHEGTEVNSTLDKRLQIMASKTVNEYSKQLSYNQIHNASAVIIEIKSGNALAYVGNSNSSGDHGQHVDVITARRSPGSLLKPFLYGLALDEGLITPYQLLPDIPIFYKGFAPKNFDKEYRGAVPANEALTSSLNVPFVHLLIDYGYEKFHQKMWDIGFKSFDRPANHYGLSIILGGAESTLWELTSVYASLSRAYSNYSTRPFRSGYSSGDYHLNRYIAKPNKTIELSSDGQIQAPSIYYTLQAMQQLNRPYEEAGWEQFASSRQIAWKTGTSYGFRDGWAIGMNNDYLIGIWVGNADGEGRPGLTGVMAAAPLMFQLFDLVEGESDLGEPFGANQEICERSGMLAGKNCPERILQPLPEYMLKNQSCTYHSIIHLDKAGKHRVNSSCYPISDVKNVPWFVLPPVQSWYFRKYHSNYPKMPAFLPSCIQSEEKSSSFDLIYPSQYTKVKIPLEQDGNKGYAIFEAAHQNKNTAIFWHLDNEYLGFTKEIHQKGIQTTTGTHTLTLVDESGNELVRKFEVID